MSISSAARRCSRRPSSSITASARFRPQLEAIGLWGFFREAWYCAIFAFSLNTAAYQAEILRGAIESVPRGQWEGAASLGLHKLQTLWKIILPQALIVALRPYGNEIILMIKGSAIVAIITVHDLMGNTRLAYSRTFDFQTYVWAAIIYLIIVETLRHAVEWIERRITIHLHTLTPIALPDPLRRPENRTRRDSKTWHRSHFSVLASWAIRWPDT